MISLALIGPGVWGKNYLRKENIPDNCRIKYVCAASKKTALQYSKHYKTTTNYRLLLERSDIQGVIIATPPKNHLSIAYDFLQAGKDVLIEKPVVTTRRGLEKLCQTCAESSQIFMGAHVYVYNAAIVAIAKELANIGRIQHVVVVDGNFGPFREDIPPLWDWAPHAISICVSLFGIPHKIRAHGIHANIGGGRRITLFDAQFQYQNFAASILSGSLLPRKQRSLYIYGKKGMITFDDLAQQKVTRVFFSTTSPQSNIKNAQIPITYGSQSPLKSQLSAFCYAIKTRKQPKTSMIHVSQVTEVIFAIEQSIKQKGKNISLRI